MTKVAVDALGGDHAPAEIVRGAVAAVREFGIDVVLVGPPAILKDCLRSDGADLPIVPATESIGMDELPAQAVRSKPDSSLVVAMRLVRDGSADAFLSAGNSGAVYAAALFDLGRIEGIERPAIGSPFRGARNTPGILIDSGANTVCKPSYLLDFAYLGAAYLERVRDVKHPAIALISNGEEASKGSPLVLEARDLLAGSDLKFIGNVEGKDVLKGPAHVYVTDGFTGNVLLKTAEGVAEYIGDELRREIRSRWYFKLAGAILRPAFRAVFDRIDPAESGGAPLLGVNGAVLIAHGRADQRAIKNGIRTVANMAEHDVVGAIRAHLAHRERRGFRKRLARTLRPGKSAG